VQRAGGFKPQAGQSAAVPTPRRPAQRQGRAVSQPPFDAAENMRFGDRRVVVGVHVASGDQHARAGVDGGVHHAMRKQTRADLEEDHVVRREARDVDGADQKDVGWPDGRQHTRARHPHACFAASPQHLRQKARRHVVEAQEFFRLTLHWD
jgi:hypothetical protein